MHEQQDVRRIGGLESPRHTVELMAVEVAVHPARHLRVEKHEEPAAVPRRRGVTHAVGVQVACHERTVVMIAGEGIDRHVETGEAIVQAAIGGCARIVGEVAGGHHQLAVAMSGQAVCQHGVEALLRVHAPQRGARIVEQMGVRELQHLEGSAAHSSSLTYTRELRR